MQSTPYPLNVVKTSNRILLSLSVKFLQLGTIYRAPTTTEYFFPMIINIIGVNPDDFVTLDRGRKRRFDR